MRRSEETVQRLDDGRARRCYSFLTFLHSFLSPPRSDQ
ncbi:hypothetical protein AZ78_1683 [Lysobacter capsici AZ78]|uniref:Uncharacterized protein n=1 Tax=Lysobacter capsici AZ78 TaxID=1444315 RepID=A0A108U7T2_9GAMM|nr:hypothetical protein AZ78_1683 [Lysobacter capsici AZ78]